MWRSGVRLSRPPPLTGLKPGPISPHEHVAAKIPWKTRAQEAEAVASGVLTMRQTGRPAVSRGETMVEPVRAVKWED
jgi:hypothetical protein